MNPYWVGIVAGFVLGAWFGFALCALLVTAKKADERAEKEGE